MGNTLCKAASELKSNAWYTLFASADNEAWRYPRVNIAQAGQEATAHLEGMREEAHFRTEGMGDQTLLICEHLWEIMWHALGILYRLWRVIYHLGRMVDEIGVEAVDLAGRAPPVLLELLERVREGQRT